MCSYSNIVMLTGSLELVVQCHVSLILNCISYMCNYLCNAPDFYLGSVQVSNSWSYKYVLYELYIVICITYFVM